MKIVSDFKYQHRMGRRRPLVSINWLCPVAPPPLQEALGAGSAVAVTQPQGTPAPSTPPAHQEGVLTPHAQFQGRRGHQDSSCQMPGHHDREVDGG